jgi:hypothetical protein
MEFDLLGVEEMEDRDVVFPEPKVLKGIAKCLGIRKKVRKDYHECALLNFFRDLMKGIDKTCVAGGLEFLEGIKNCLKLGSSTTGRNFEVDFFVTAAQSGRISLIDDEVGKGSCNFSGEVDFSGVITG